LQAKGSFSFSLLYRLDVSEKVGALDQWSPTPGPRTNCYRSAKLQNVY